MNLDFGGILKRAWDITWRNKILWIFGILSAIGSGGARSGSNINFPRGENGLPDFSSRFPNMDQNTVTAIVIGVACVILILAVVVWLLSIVGRGGLIGGINLAETGVKVSFGQAWAIGTKNFITVLLIGLGVAILSIVVALGSAVAVASLCLAPLGCIGFLLIPVLSVFTYLAQIAAVTDNLSVGAAFGRAWEVVKANLVSVIVLGLILVIVTFCISFVVALPLGLVVAPAVAGLMLGAASDNASVATGGLAIAAICLVAWIPVLILVRGIVETWVTSSWILAYRRFTGPAPAPMAPLAPPPMAS